MQPNSEPKKNPPSQSQVKILLIEDDEVDAKWVERALRDSPTFRLTHAGTMAAGLEFLRTETYDVILSDLHLPDASGLEVFNALSEQKPDAPIVLLTGSILDEQHAMEAIHQGAQDYLIKGQVDQRSLLRALNYAMERKKLLLMRDHFVHVVSHELKNPLTTLQTSIWMLHEGMVVDAAEQKEILQITLNAIRRLVRTTEDLLDLAKMEKQKYSFRRANFSLNSLVQEIGQFFRREIESKGLAFKAIAPDHDVEIFADRDQIARVLTNLIHNALKFTRTGQIEIRAEEDQDLIRCSVADTGPGVAPEDIPRLFQKFSQPGKAHAAKGTGLGLSICREILEAHQGTICAESTPGKGARFIFTIPKAAATKGQAAATAQ
ncbi:MAG: hybrid sensor histidine kinase/response regulator [Elusimicrobia bacterium]|nr:hybrid sensor histidine kinase/response regulator [Elusimicrobiota bacterium]